MNNFKKAGLKRWSDPDYREKMVAIHRTDESLSKASARQKALWADPEFRKKTLTKLAVVRRSPEFREKLRNKRLEALKDPAFAARMKLWVKKGVEKRDRAAQSEKMKELWTEERKLKQREKMKELWSNPEFAEQRKLRLRESQRTVSGKHHREMKHVRCWADSSARIVFEENGIKDEPALNSLIALLGILFCKEDFTFASPEKRLEKIREDHESDSFGIASLRSSFPTLTPEIISRCLTLMCQAQEHVKENPNPQNRKTRSGFGKNHSPNRSKLECSFQADIESLTGTKAEHISEIGDIVFSKERVCIEIDGDVFHAVSDHHNSATQPVSKMFHRNKTLCIRSHGYRAIRFWGHEILSRRQQCLNFVLGAMNHGRKIGARETEVREIDKKTAEELVDAWHIQKLNQKNFRFAAALFEHKTGKPVAVIVFGNHHRKTGEICLSRLAFDFSVNISGGSEKLMSFCKRTFFASGDVVTSWSHERLGNGGVYRRLGFRKTGTVKPDYHYVGRAGNVISKQMCPRKTLRRKLDRLGIAWSHDETEEDLAAHLSMSRCYDAGKIKWEFVV